MRGRESEVPGGAVFEAVADPDTGSWFVGGEDVGSAPVGDAPAWVMQRVAERLTGPGPWPVRVWDGQTCLELVIGVDGSVASSSLAEPVVPGTVDSLAPADVAVAPRRKRGLVIGGVVAAVLLAGGLAAAAVLGAGGTDPRPGAPASVSASSAVPVLWHVDGAPGEVQYAGHGVLVVAGPDSAEVRSLADGRSLGTAKLPGTRPRVVSGSGWVAVVSTGPDGTNTGLVASRDSFKEFSGVKGSLVLRGVDPFFLTGTGLDQGALVWDGTGWKPVPAPEPGMAPVAASPSGVLWLGTGGRLLTGSTSATLAAPEPAAKTASWVWADEKSVAVLWDTAAGNVLAVHSLSDGKITGQAPAPGTEFRREGGLVLSGSAVFSFDTGTPVAVDACPGPVPAGGSLWCRAEETWAAPGAGPLAQGQTPVPSPAEVVVTVSEGGFTAYTGDAVKSDHENPKEK